ncbi:MAG: SWIM zinc finger family protein [Firmicutes bacterium]|nr:SWIM zinc finger family protein [Bacillota bacterium]
MSVLSLASGQSVYRGYEYFKEQKVSQVEQVDEGIVSAKVAGSNGSHYDVMLDIAHPRKSKCNCPHAEGKRIICKHMVAAYFTVRPWEAKKYIEELESFWEEEEQRQEEQEEKLIRYVHSMKKSELQQALLQLLFEGPEWQYDRFIEYNVEWNSK